MDDASCPLRTGDTIAGKYRVLRTVAVGGMGAVVAAWHADLEQQVAIKVMLSGVAHHAESVQRFLREARASVKLRSEHVARVLDVGRLDGGQPYIVMELLEGQDLSSLVRSRGALPIADAVDFVCQACEAVAEAHSCGIVHRDLKPANLFLTVDAHREPCVKVLDFGISKVRPAADSPQSVGLTSTSAVMGTPLYMAPEQMRSARNADERSDIWALGTILFELITARVAFAGETVTEVITAVLTGPSPSARALCPNVPEGLDRALLRCFAKEPAERFDSVAAFVSAISGYGSGRARRTMDRLGGPLSDARSADASLSSTNPAQLPRGSSTDVAWHTGQTGVALTGPRRLRALWMTGAALVLVLGATGLWWGMRGRSTLSDRAVSTPGVESVVTPSPAASVTVSSPIPSTEPPAAAQSLTASRPSDTAGMGGDTKPLSRRAPKDAGPVTSSPAPPQASLQPPPPPPPTSKKRVSDFGGRE
jgi:eukaryotic-like serine/threonine-protein kinase